MVHYDPRLGRFMSADPLGGSVVNPQSLNRYAYVANNPPNLRDPSGLATQDQCRVVGQTCKNLIGPGAFVDPGSCTLDGVSTDCSLVVAVIASGAAALCLDAPFCSYVAPLDAQFGPASGIAIANFQLGFATMFPPCAPYGDCSPSVHPQLVEVDLNVTVIVYYPAASVPESAAGGGGGKAQPKGKPCKESGINASGKLFGYPATLSFSGSLIANFSTTGDISIGAPSFGVSMDLTINAPEEYGACRLLRADDKP